MIDCEAFRTQEVIFEIGVSHDYERAYNVDTERGYGRSMPPDSASADGG